MEENINIRKDIISVTDNEFEKQLRPLSFVDFKGQKQVMENLVVFVTAAKQRPCITARSSGPG
jgi:Holliday junction DNA helicase RuvB